MSTHKIEVIKIDEILPHPDADKLGIVKVWGYQVCVGLDSWKVGDLAAYCPPDYMVPMSRTEFAFLDAGKGRSYERVRVKKLRGVLSQGLLVPAPTGFDVGDCVMEHFGISRYEPPEPTSTGGDNTYAPNIVTYKYDVENFERYNTLFVEGEEVVATEKIHGANGRYVYVNNEMFCGSKTCWKKESETNAWWNALRNTPWLRPFCEAHPGLVVYGEVYGTVQKLKYGLSKAHFRAFDILKDGQWMNYRDARSLIREWNGGDWKILNKAWVPKVYRGPFNASVLEMAEGPSLVPTANHYREGIVIRPVVERTDVSIGRVCLKVVSESYLKKS